MNESEPVWLKLIKLRTTSPMLFRTLIAILAIELAAILIAPIVIPEKYYLKRFLSDKAENAIQEFLSGEGFLIADKTTGWRNQPNVSFNNWKIDAFGSRSHRHFSIQPTKPIRTLLLGSSMINGGTGITNQETISAYLEDANIEALNFGTMLFSFDQSLLLLHELIVLKPNVVIIGLDSNPVSGLSNIFIPFRNKNEVNVAFLKPKYYYKDKQLEKIDINPQSLGVMFEDESVQQLLKQHDGYYHHFERFMRFGHTPLANLAGIALRKYESFSIYQHGQPENEKILIDLIKQAISLSKQHPFKLILLSMPSRSIIKPNRLMRTFPNWHKQRIEHYRSLGITIIDSAEIFTQYQGPLSDLYDADDIHYTPVSNKLIANHLRKLILDAQASNSGDINNP